jgi:glutathione S-transferase
MPMNIKARHKEFPLWRGAQADVDRIVDTWSTCLGTSGDDFAAYRDRLLDWPPMREWIARPSASPTRSELDIEC